MSPVSLSEMRSAPGSEVKETALVRFFGRCLGPVVPPTLVQANGRMIARLTTLCLAVGAGLTACASGRGSPGEGRPFPCPPSPVVDISNTRDLSTGFGSIAGHVLSSTSVPIIGAQISVSDSTGALITSALTDTLGQFSIDSVAAGLRTVRIEFIGFETQDHYSQIVPNAGRLLCAVLQERPVHLMPIRVLMNPTVRNPAAFDAGWDEARSRS